MCFRSPPPPPAPAPLPPAPTPPAPPSPLPPALPDQLPDAEVRPVNPAVREAQSKLGTKKGKKGSTADLRIDKKKTPNIGQLMGTPINTGNTNTTGGLQ